MRRAALALALALAAGALAPSPSAVAVGPGGWERLGSQIQFGNPASSINNDVMAMTTDVAGVLIAGGKFTNAAGIPGANHIASWDGAAWHQLGPASSFNGDVLALAVAGGKIYAGGSFTNAGGDADADFLAVYDGVSWTHACTGGGSPITGNVHALQVVGGDLYVGGAFTGVAGLPHTVGLFRCNLGTGVPTSTTVDPVHDVNGVVYALAADSASNLYAGGGFSDLENNPASDKIARLPLAGVWTNLGSGAGACGCAVDDFVRALADDGTNLYVGTDADNIAGIAQADHLAKWNGASWSALGANAAGTDGYLASPSIGIYALHAAGSHVFASGSWLDAGGDPTADYLADFDGTLWKPVGSDGAGNGALNAKGESITVYGGVLHVGGNFTKAGGDSLATAIARFVGVPIPPSNAFTLAKAKVNKANGTATISVTVPGVGVITMVGTGVKSQRATGLRLQPVTGAGVVKLKVKAKGKTLKKLRAHGKVKVKVTITFTPTGGTARSETKKVKLVLKRRS